MPHSGNKSVQVVLKKQKGHPVLDVPLLCMRQSVKVFLPKSCGSPKTVRMVSHHRLVLIIHLLHPAADACKHLIRYGVERIRQNCYGQVLAEYLHGVALFAVNVRHVY